MNETTDLPSTIVPKPRKLAMKPQAGVQGLINLALMIWAIWDIRHRSDDEIKGNRRLWMLAAFATPIGPIAYFVFGRKRRAPATEIPLETTEPSS